tara:strand:+ start:1633 stop:1812 length:180 start_codon:yes stop_codon:yes gene_type:complete
MFPRLADVPVDGVMSPRVRPHRLSHIEVPPEVSGKMLVKTSTGSGSSKGALVEMATPSV